MSYMIKKPTKFTAPKFNIGPEKWWLEDDPFLLGFGNFSGENSLLNFGRVKVGPEPSGVRFFFVSGRKIPTISKDLPNPGFSGPRM